MKRWWSGVTSLRTESAIDEYLDVIKQNLMTKENQIAALQDQLKEARDAAYVSNELSKIKDELDIAKADLIRGFPISAEKMKAINEWQTRHEEEIHHNFDHYHGTSGGGYLYEFYPTAIGTSGVCVCEVCKRRAYDMAYALGRYNSEKYHRYMKKFNSEFQFQDFD